MAKIQTPTTTSEVVEQVESTTTCAYDRCHRLACQASEGEGPEGPSPAFGPEPAGNSPTRWIVSDIHHQSEVMAFGPHDAFWQVHGLPVGEVATSTDLGYEPEVEVKVENWEATPTTGTLTFERLAPGSDKLVVELWEVEDDGGEGPEGPSPAYGPGSLKVEWCSTCQRHTRFEKSTMTCQSCSEVKWVKEELKAVLAVYGSLSERVRKNIENRIGTGALSTRDQVIDACKRAIFRSQSKPVSDWWSEQGEPADLMKQVPVGRCLVEVSLYEHKQSVVASSVEHWLSRAGEPLSDCVVVVHEQTGRRQHLAADRVKMIKMLGPDPDVSPVCCEDCWQYEQGGEAPCSIHDPEGESIVLDSIEADNKVLEGRVQ